MTTVLEQPGFDTWLARELHRRGWVELGVLQQLLAEARVQRGRGGTLATLLVERGQIEAEQVLELFRQVGVAETVPSAPPGQPEELLGEYRLLKQLGAGGMGTVHLAEHVQTGARYAVKSLPAFGDPEFVARFQREGEAQARVDRHRNVVGVHALGQAQGRLYLVMDLVSGGDLAERLREGPMEPDAAARLVRDLAVGLAHVHAKGVLHRDLKPANVLIAEDGTPKLVDFGLARIADADALTQTGAIMGTPAYMAPEQVEGKRDEIGPATDVYGLGALLYHCLTGEPPFTGGSPLVVMSKAARDAPAPPRRLRPEVPAALEAICLRTLEKAAADRPASADALRAELEGYLSGGAAPRSRLPFVLAGLAVVGTLIGVAAALTPASTPSPQPEATSGSDASDEDRVDVPDVVRGSWPVQLDAEQLARAEEVFGRYEAARAGDEAASLPPSAVRADGEEALSLLQEAARVGHAEALFELGRAHLNRRDELVAQKLPGRGLQHLRRSVRFGGQRAAAMLAEAHHPRRANRLQVCELGVLPDATLCAALLVVAHGSPEAARAAADSGLTTALGEDPFPSLDRAYARVEATYEPAWVPLARAHADVSLDAITALAPPERVAEEVARIREDGPSAHTLGTGLEMEELPVAVHLFRKAAAESTKSRRILARLLIQGQLSGTKRQHRIHVQVAPLAGLYDLFLMAEAGHYRSMFTLAQVYAGEPVFSSAVDPDLAVVAAWCYLARGDPALRAEIQGLAGGRPVLRKHTPLSDQEAWTRVRRALPWNLPPRDPGTDLLSICLHRTLSQLQPGDEPFFVRYSLERARRVLARASRLPPEEQQAFEEQIRKLSRDEVCTLGTRLLDSKGPYALAKGIQAYVRSAAADFGQARRRLASLLLYGQTKHRTQAYQDSLERVPVAGLWLLVDLARRNESYSELAYLYAHFPPTPYVDKDLSMASALLVVNRDQRTAVVRFKIETLSTKLPPAPTLEEARERVKDMRWPWQRR